MMTEHVVTVQEAPHNNANKPQSDQPLAWIRINTGYFRTTPGLLKIVQLILGILCMSLATPYIGGTHFFLFVATTSFIGTLIWVVIYLLGVREALSIPINWILTEMLNTAICTAFYVLAFIIQIIGWAGYYGHARASNIAAGVFGIFNAMAYGMGTYLLYMEHKNSRTN